MSNRVSVTIDGREYNIIAAEDEAYVRKVAAHVDGLHRQLSFAIRAFASSTMPSSAGE